MKIATTTHRLGFWITGGRIEFINKLQEIQSYMAMCKKRSEGWYKVIGCDYCEFCDSSEMRCWLKKEVYTWKNEWQWERKLFHDVCVHGYGVSYEFYDFVMELKLN